MKQVKLIVWIAVLTFIETAVSVFFNINGIVPDLLLAFTAAYAVHERSLRSVMITAAVCGVITCAVSADEFVVVMIVYTVCAAAAYMSYELPHRPAGAVRAAVITALFSAAEGAALYALYTLSFDTERFIYVTLPVTAINAVCAMIIYVALTRCFRLKDSAKKLIIS